MALRRGLVRLLAVACGLTVANVYYAQPLLHTIAASLHTRPSAVGVLVTLTQLGFAAGLALVVPLGDILPRRPLLATLLGIDALVLAATAAAPGLAVLAGLAVPIGLCSVVVQMLIPYAATLAADEERAATIGTLMGGLLLGILLSRTVAGLIASAVGWRGVYVVAAALMTGTALTLARLLPGGQREVAIGFGAQLRAIARLARTQPVLRWRALVGAGQFAAFSCFWTTVTFLLAGAPFGYSQAQIGLFALVGAAGAGSVLTGGRVLDRHRRLRWPLTGVGAVVLLGSFGLLALGRDRLLWLVVGALLMDACSQAVHVANQAVIYDLVDAARSRITTVYMTTYFLGGAIGSAGGTRAYDRYGWAGAGTVAAGCAAGSILAWAATGRFERASAQSAAVPHKRDVRAL